MKSNIIQEGVSKVNKIKKTALALSLLSIVNSNVVFADTESDLQKKINENNSNIEALEDKKNELNEEISNEYSELESLVSDIEAKSSELEAAKNEVAYYQGLINEVQAEIDTMNNEIYALTEQIKIKEELIVQKEIEMEETKALLDNRIRSYSKIDMTTEIVYMILESESLTSFFQNIDNAYKIISLDRELITSITKFNEEMAIEKEEIKVQVSRIEDNKVSIEGKQSELIKVQEELVVKQNSEQGKMDELLALENEKNSIIGQLSDAETEVANEIGELLIYNEELQAELDNLFAQLNTQEPVVNEVASAQGFLRPGYGVVTDSFGHRINPVTFEEGNHNGVDFADPYGANVYASKSGTVVYSGWISGYGNTIIIDHGSGVQTLYGHNSELKASVGQDVQQGDVVALVGSTGMSTGPHIHFEIRINGQPVNPLDYL